MYHEINKINDTNHVYKVNKILIIDVYNPGNVDEETIN